MSQSLVPNSFLFRYALRCPYVPRMPSSGTHFVSLPKNARVPVMSAMDGKPQFADVWMGWNESGLGIAFEVRAKEQPVHGEPNKLTGCDGMSLWLDMRDTRSIHRAGRYCQRFLICAHDGSDKGLPVVRRHPIRRALEEPPAVDESQIRVARFAFDEDGDVVETTAPKKVKAYRMEVFLPATVLHGFDPESNKRLGMFYRLRDNELGDQIFSGAPEMPYWEDPSLWATLVLVKK